jgi:tetratricopeptide (TPR) repeat protein
MQGSVLIFFSIFITTAMIYFLYKFLLGISDGQQDDDLQITERDLLEQLNILFREKKYYIIENLAGKYLERKFANDEVRIILARAFFESGKYYNAIEQARVILRHKPDDFEVKNFIVNCYLKVSKYLDAIIILKEVVDSDPSNVVAIKELANLYCETNQKISALKMYKKLETLILSNQEKVKIKTIIANLHIEFREFDAAIKVYQEILDLHPDDLSIKKNLCALYKLNLDFERQVETANEIYEVHRSEEDDIWALNFLVDTYYDNGNYDEALEYARLLETMPLADILEVKEKISKILIKIDKIDDSIELLKQLIEENPDNIDLKKLLASAYYEENNFEMAIGIYKKILDQADFKVASQINSKISELYSDWAIFLFNNDENEECFKKFNSALEYDSENSDIYYRLGQINMLIKNYNEAISQIKMSIDLNSENSNYYYALAECYEAIDNQYEQKNNLLKAVKYNTEENNSQIYYKLALIFDSQNDTNNALNYLHKAIDINPKFVDAKYKLALILEYNGDKEGAIALYNEILSLDPGYTNAQDNLKMLTAN